MQHGTLEDAMDNAASTVKRAIAAFDLSARQLLDRHFDDGDVLSGLVKFIHGCRCACTANMNWR